MLDFFQRAVVFIGMLIAGLLGLVFAAVSLRLSSDHGVFMAVLPAFFTVVCGIVSWKGFRFLKGREGKSPSKPNNRTNVRNFPILTVDDKHEAGYGRWYRLRHWKTGNFVKMTHEFPEGWKVFSDDEAVAGVTFENRENTYLFLNF